MPTVSEQLRQARELQALTVQQVAEATKIKSDYVRAIDDGNFETFTAPVYIRGFVRTYAGMLRLDVPEIMASLDAELSQSKTFAEAPALTGHNQTWVDKLMYHLSKIRWQIFLPVAGAIVLIVVGFSWFQHWQEQRKKDPISELGSGAFPSHEHSSADTLAVPK